MHSRPTGPKRTILVHRQHGIVARVDRRERLGIGHELLPLRGTREPEITLVDAPSIAGRLSPSGRSGQFHRAIAVQRHGRLGPRRSPALRPPPPLLYPASSTCRWPAAPTAAAIAWPRLSRAAMRFAATPLPRQTNTTSAAGRPPVTARPPSSVVPSERRLPLGSMFVSFAGRPQTSACVLRVSRLRGAAGAVTGSGSTGQARQPAFDGRFSTAFSRLCGSGCHAAAVVGGSDSPGGGSDLSGWRRAACGFRRRRGCGGGSGSWPSGVGSTLAQPTGDWFAPAVVFARPLPPRRGEIAEIAHVRHADSSGRDADIRPRPAQDHFAQAPTPPRFRSTSQKNEPWHSVLCRQLSGCMSSPLTVRTVCA